MSVDNDSPPGSWKSEMDRMPWRYSTEVQAERALAAIRAQGLVLEANALALEIKRLQNEIESLKNGTNAPR